MLEIVETVVAVRRLSMSLAWTFDHVCEVEIGRWSYEAFCPVV